MAHEYDREGGGTSPTQRLDAFQRRHPVVGFPIGVIYKFVEDQGPYLAALITYYGFLSLFPLLLLLTSVLGFVLDGRPGLQEQILDSTLSQFPVIGDQLADPQGLQGSVGAIIVGGLVAVYGALGFAQAIQNAINVSWSVPRNRRPNPIRARLRSLRLIAVAGIAVVVTTVLSGAGSNAGAFGAELGRSSTLVALGISIVVNGMVFVVMFRIFRPDGTRTRDTVPGAIVAAVIWQLLQVFGAVFVGSGVQGSGATYGTFALVLGLFAWTFLAAVGIVVGSEINVVRVRRLYPRALLTPFTDNVDLTEADQRAYLEAVNSQQFKGFQSVTVRYEDDGQQASARRARNEAGEQLDGSPDHP
ncbi:MAG: YihY/virulence factor BrkB family protein [Ilumatobacter sp.]|uniref:YihY/virulence factor BrkB family protein n=1 Tax=Ilumatobacter sp. TaxID=1967498 RepID=UPI003299D4F4